MGSINVNMGVPRTSLLVACLESSGGSGFLSLLRPTLYIDPEDLLSTCLTSSSSDALLQRVNKIYFTLQSL